MSKELLFGESARVALLKGINTLADAVQSTMGPKGRVVIIEHPYGPPSITKDGVSVAKQVHLKDKFENLGAQVVRQAAARSADKAGDGTTTATVLARALITEGQKAIDEGNSSVDIKKGIDIAVKHVVKELLKLSKECKDVAQVATLSANGDEDIGKIIAKATEAVGKDGVITVAESATLQNELEMVDGIELNSGYLSPHFATNGKVEMDDPFILLIDKKITSIHELVPILEEASKAGRPVLIVVDEITGETLGTLVVNKMNGIIQTAVVKAPGVGDLKRDILDDLGVLTKGRVVSDVVGKHLEGMSLADLGQAKRVVVTATKTTIIDGAGDPTERIELLKSEIKECTEPQMLTKLKERLAKLSGGVAVIKIGAATEVELQEKRDRVEDSLAATRAAIDEGVVPGGGLALFRSKVALSAIVDDRAGVNLGIRIVEKVLEAPMRAIMSNAGAKYDTFIKLIEGSKNNDVGYNAETGACVDLVKAGVLDPTKVTRVAIENAASVAGLILTTSCMIAINREETDNA